MVYLPEGRVQPACRKGACDENDKSAPVRVPLSGSLCSFFHAAWPACWKGPWAGVRVLPLIPSGRLVPHIPGAVQPTVPSRVSLIGVEKINVRHRTAHQLSTFGILFQQAVLFRNPYSPIITYVNEGKLPFIDSARPSSGSGRVRSWENGLGCTGFL